ncbi:MAG: hypothetical protein K2G03_03335 [Bacilli bacterium]|nr:hypothetical protein [Bacilli bacterium]
MIKIYPSVKKKEGKEILYEIRRDYGGVFRDFYDTLKAYEHINWDFFFYKLNDIDIVLVDEGKKFSNKGALAKYALLSNKMYIKAKSFKSAIMHEVLHLSSCVVTKKCLYLGFLQVDRESGSIIGIGLNEGYTNLLDKRYFPDYDEDKGKDLRYTYMVTTSIANLLEHFVGKESMEKWYFSADLNSLINYLSDYVPREECICFLLAIDNVFNFLDNGCVKHPLRAAWSYRYIINFMGRCYMNLYIEEYYNKFYGKEELKERLLAVYELMENRLKFTKLKIPLTKKISKEDFHAYVKYEKNNVLKKCS